MTKYEVDYNASKLRTTLREDPDLIYDLMIDCSRSYDKKTFLALAEAVVTYEMEMIASAKAEK